MNEWVVANAAGKGYICKLADKVLSNMNLTEACLEVVKNKGAGGVDGMSVKQPKAYSGLYPVANQW